MELTDDIPGQLFITPYVCFHCRHHWIKILSTKRYPYANWLNQVPVLLERDKQTRRKARNLDRWANYAFSNF